MFYVSGLSRLALREENMNSRRGFLRNVLTGAGMVASARVLSAHEMDMPLRTDLGKMMEVTGARGSRHDHVSPILVETPDVPNLPYRMDGNVKEFHLIAEPVKQEIIPGRVADLWGYNGSAPGPTIQVTRGDRVRIVVDNHLPEPTSMHWHGFEIPYDMDGAPGLSQEPIPPGGRFVYEFTLNQDGTYFYHSHMAMQEMMGMIGAFIMHPKEAYQPRAVRDFVVIMQEYAILPNNTVPNSMSMEFNWLTFNGKSAPATTPLLVRQGERVRIRLINLGMDHHPIHLHGCQFVITGTEGGRQPASTWGPQNTVLVGVAQARDIEFEATSPGDWMLHCHLPHHMMNHMSSNVGPMTRGTGMFTGIPDVSKNANSVPGFPQDAFMEGPMMAMDKMVDKPENYGLRPGWSGFMGGMMTFVRVLLPEKYDKILELRNEQRGKKPNAGMPGMERSHE
jgi:FtsP/CotA-like multicopper oxidase with cupredoxin domain